MSTPTGPILDYTTRRRNPSPVLERRRMLVRRAAGQYLLGVSVMAVAMCVLAWLVGTYFTC